MSVNPEVLYRSRQATTGIKIEKYSWIVIRVNWCDCGQILIFPFPNRKWNPQRQLRFSAVSNAQKAAKKT